MPSNTTPETATEIPTIPYSITVAMGAYNPTLHIWHGDNTSTFDDDTLLNGFEAARKPCVLPVVPGETYYFQVEDGASFGSDLWWKYVATDSDDVAIGLFAWTADTIGADLEFSVLPAPAQALRFGDLFIPDDTDGFPASISSQQDGTVRRLVNFPATERAGVLPSGEILTASTVGGDHLELYDRTLTLIASIARQGGSIRGNGDDTFYVFDGDADEVITVSRTGVVGGTTWATGALTSKIAVNRAGTVLYYVAAAVPLGAALQRWDLVNDIALTDVPSSAVAGYTIAEDVLVLADDTVLVAYKKATATVDYYVRRYSADGATILNTYNFGTVEIDRLALGVGDESFWIYFHLADAKSRFTQIDPSDGSTIVTFDFYQCNAGFFTYATPFADPPRFGHSQSCPFLILNQAETYTLVPTLPSIPCCDDGGCGCDEDGPDGSPSSAPPRTATGPQVPPVTPPPTPMGPTYWEALCAGGGDVPSAADATDAESWVS